MSVDRMIISDRKDGQFCSNLFKVVMLDLRTWRSGVIGRQHEQHDATYSIRGFSLGHTKSRTLSVFMPW